MVCYGTYRNISLMTSTPVKSPVIRIRFWGCGEMTENTKTRPITIDLNQFKLHIALRNRIELTLHFNSPSRRFYLAVIALVGSEMKKQGKITSIVLEVNYDLLALLNETIGGSAGSSEEENLLSRIYNKWKYALPNLEEAPLFMVLGRKKGYEEGIGKTYRFTEAEKDSWANLFEYKGSHENVRLKFAIDKIGATLNDIAIIYEDSLNAEAWEKFISDLKEKKTESDKPVSSIQKMAFSLPDNPSIVVLPFVNMSGDPKQEFLCDGFTENITTTLSMIPELFVIARNSAFGYKEKPIDVKKVSENLGVRYVLEGSVQMSGGRIRINVQLIDAISGHHIWSEKYDRDMTNLFALLDDVTRNIAVALQIKLTEGEQARVFHRDTKNLEAWALASQAFDVIQRFTREDVARAKELSEQAVKLDPQYGFAWSLLAWAYFDEAISGWCESGEEYYKKAVELNQKALALNKDLFCATAMLGSIYLYQRQYERAIKMGRRSIELGPNIALNYAILAITLNYAGNFEEAITLGERAIRLHPFCPLWYLDTLATSCRMAGRYEEALALYRQILPRAQEEPFYLFPAHIGLAEVYSEMGRVEEAHTQAKEILRIAPRFSLESWGKRQPFKDAKHLEKRLTALRKAGLN